VIGAVVALARKAEDNGGRAVLCRLAPQLREAMTNMGLHRLWMFYGTREEALEAIRGRG
jgi:anti-anti-sigma regulatory factor